jgi:prepilin-type processing-associated H-X9-DG protein
MVFSDFSSNDKSSITYDVSDEQLGFRHQGNNALHADWHVEFWNNDAFPRKSKFSNSYYGAFYKPENTSGNITEK